MLRMKFLPSFLLVLTFALYAGCGNSNGSTGPVVPSEGTYAWLQANLDEQNNLQLAATVYDDGVKVDLVGGDVISATQGAQSVQLKGVSLRSGDYAGVMSNSNEVDPIVFSIDYEPEQSRDDRWYPHDVLRVDPGAGALVGLQAQAMVPPRVSILTPAANTTVMGQLTAFELAWEPAGEGDEMRLAANVTCTGDGDPLTYAVGYSLGADDGAATLNMAQFVPNNSVLELADVLINSLARILVEAMFDTFFFGLLDPAFENPLPQVIEGCDLDLVLFRERQSEIIENFDNGLVIGSASAGLHIIYLRGE